MTNSNSIWRRTVVTRRDGTLVPLSDNWSLIDLESGIAVAQMYLDTGYQDRPAWRVICRTINDEGVLADSIMTWYEAPTVAKKYAEAQAAGLQCMAIHYNSQLAVQFYDLMRLCSK